MMTFNKTLLGPIIALVVVVAMVALSAAVCPVIRPLLALGEKADSAVMEPDTPQQPPAGKPDGVRPPPPAGKPDGIRPSPPDGKAVDLRMSPPLRGDAAEPQTPSPTDVNPLALRGSLLDEGDAVDLRLPLLPSPHGRQCLSGSPPPGLDTVGLDPVRRRLLMSPVAIAPFPLAEGRDTLEPHEEGCRRAGGENALRRSRPENFFFHTVRMTKRLLKMLKKVRQ